MADWLFNKKPQKDKKIVNGVKTKLGSIYSIQDKRIPTPTADDAGKVLGTDEEGNFTYIEPGIYPHGTLAITENGDYDISTYAGIDVAVIPETQGTFRVAENGVYNIARYSHVNVDVPAQGGVGGELRDLFNDALEEVNIPQSVKKIPYAAFIDKQAVKTVDIRGVREGIDDYAFYNSENIKTIRLGKVDGEIGQAAFSGTLGVEEFYLDPTSEITKLGWSAFAGIGQDRATDTRLVFDFRNSSFKDFHGFGMPTMKQTINGSYVDVKGIGAKNADIYLPTTVTNFLGYEIGMMSGTGSGGVLHNCKNIDLYLSGTNFIPLYDLDTLPNDSKSHVYTPYETFGMYYIATNWAAYNNLRCYAQYPEGTVLPTYDLEGYELKWYSDKTMTSENLITESTGSIAYAKHTGNRLYSKIELDAAYLGTVTVSDGEHAYTFGELVPIGTQLTITPKYTGEGDADVSLFRIYNTDYTDAATVKITRQNLLITILYNIETLPNNYLTAADYWSSSHTMSIRSSLSSGSMMPTTINILPYYRYNGNFYKVTDLASSAFRSRLPNNCEITLPNTLTRLQSDTFRDYQNKRNNITINLPDTITYIDYGCFSGNGKLTIKGNRLPKHLTSIGSMAFQGCTGLDGLILPASLSRIGYSAFGDCNYLTAMYYEGRPEDLDIIIYSWSATQQSSNAHFKNILHYYSETTPTDTRYKWWHYVDGVPEAWPNN